MGIGESVNISHQKETPVTEERAKTVEEVYIKYREELLKWCKHRLRERRISDNLEEHAQEIVSRVFLNLLKNESSVDLNRTDSEIQQYLNTALDFAVGTYFREKNSSTRIPEKKLVPIDEAIDGLPTHEFNEHSFFDKDIANRALQALEQKDKRGADILRKRFFEEKTIEEIAEEYGVTKDTMRNWEIKALSMVKKFIRYGTI